MKKYMLALLNTLPFFLCFLFYKFALGPLLFFPVLQLLINIFNYDYSERIAPFLGWNLLMLVSSVASIWLYVLLYYKINPSDFEALGMIEAGIQFCTVFIALMTLISVVCKIKGRKNNMKMATKKHIAPSRKDYKQ